MGATPAPSAGLSRYFHRELRGRWGRRGRRSKKSELSSSKFIFHKVKALSTVVWSFYIVLHILLTFKKKIYSKLQKSTDCVKKIVIKEEI